MTIILGTFEMHYIGHWHSTNICIVIVVVIIIIIIIIIIIK